MLRSVSTINSIISEQIDKGIPAERIILGGFSQGGAMSLFSGLTAPVKLAGIVALSAYLVLHYKLVSNLPDPQMNKETPVFFGHGDSDQVVPVTLGKRSFDMLNNWGYKVEWHEYK